MSSRRNNRVCVKFSSTPEETQFREGTYSWVPKADALEYINEGYGKEYDPVKKSIVNDEPPTKDDLKDTIIDYLKKEGIDHDPKDKKEDLLELIK